MMPDCQTARSSLPQPIPQQSSSSEAALSGDRARRTSSSRAPCTSASAAAAAAWSSWLPSWHREAKRCDALHAMMRKPGKIEAAMLFLMLMQAAQNLKERLKNQTADKHDDGLVNVNVTLFAVEACRCQAPAQGSKKETCNDETSIERETKRVESRQTRTRTSELRTPVPLGRLVGRQRAGQLRPLG